MILTVNDNIISVSFKPDYREFPFHPHIAYIMQKQISKAWYPYLISARHFLLGEWNEEFWGISVIVTFLLLYLAIYG